MQDVIDFANAHHFENLIAVDNTASEPFVESYISLIESGFNLVSSNKIANTISLSFYNELREKLKKNSERENEEYTKRKTKRKTREGKKEGRKKRDTNERGK